MMPRMLVKMVLSDGDERDEDGNGDRGKGVSLLVINADSFAIEATEDDVDMVLFQKGDELVLALPEEKYLGHWESP